MTRAQHPIRLRLTAWYAGSALVLLLATVALLHVAFQRTIAAEFDRGLASSLALAQRVFRLELAEYVSAEATVRHVAGETQFQDRRIDFVSPAGVVLAAASPASGTDTLAAPIRMVQAPLDARLAPGWTVRVRASAAGVERELRDIDFRLALGVPASILVAALIGWWLTGRTLRPVSEMAAAADRLTSTGGAGRLPIADADDELGQLGTRFNALLDRLERASAQQRRFLAEAAHELRTPIARMLGRVELALVDQRARQQHNGNGNGDGHGDGARAEVLDAVHGELQRTSALVDELLQLARVDAGERAAHLEPLYVDDIVLGAVEGWRPAAERRGVCLALSRTEEAPAMLDAGLAHRMLGVLIDNAIRYTPRGGRVDVRVWRDGGRAVVEVEDTGVGIPADERPRIFDRFFRGREARRVAPEGSGLGLPIAAAAAAVHHGTLELLPAATGGTIAHLSLPVAAP